VNQPYTGASRLRASRISGNTDREIARTSTKQPSLPRSLGGDSAVVFAEYLNAADIPVSLPVTYDPTRTAHNVPCE
jgi:hypothetical protein